MFFLLQEDDANALMSVVAIFFKMQLAMSEVKAWHGPENVLHVYSEDLITYPRHVLSGLCDFLQVECSREYMNDCVKILYPSASRMRDKIKWPQEVISHIQNRINQFEWLKRYSFKRDL